MEKTSRDLNYEPVVTYEQAIVETVEWITRAVARRDWQEVLPKAAAYLGDRFDYGAEDAFVRTLN